MKLNNLQEGAQRLLTETCQILNDEKINYIIVGGWSPFLLNGNPINHPGTKDVDVLFEDGYKRENLKGIILKFLDKGYLLSAKHDFQLFKEIEVENKKFIYNIDLLHPSETKTPDEIYIDHIDLGIPSDKYKSSTFKMKSIALPSSQILFSHDLKTILSIDGVKINLMNEIGTLITKSESIKIPKRYRDSLDVYFAITQNKDYPDLIKNLRNLKEKDPDGFNSLYGIRKFYESNEIKMYNNIKRFIGNYKLAEFKESMNSFISDIGLDKEAAH